MDENQHPLDVLPALKEPLLDDALAAEQAFVVAKAANQKAEALVEGISPEQADTILQWVVHRTRKAMLDNARIAWEGSVSPVAFFENPDTMPGRCLQALSFASAQTKYIWGIESFRHQTNLLLRDEYTAHAFLVVAMPIHHADGKVKPSYYLIDPTFRQFCGREDHDPWVREIIKTSEGHVFVQGLLKQGYMPLSEQVAALYLDSHVKSIEKLIGGRPMNAPEIEGKALELLSRESFHQGNWFSYDGDRKYKIDLRTPQMVADGVAIEALAEKYAPLPQKRVARGGGLEGLVTAPAPVSGVAVPAPK